MVTSFIALVWMDFLLKESSFKSLFSKEKGKSCQLFFVTQNKCDRLVNYQILKLLPQNKSIDFTRTEFKSLS